MGGRRVAKERRHSPKNDFSLKNAKEWLPLFWVGGEWHRSFCRSPPPITSVFFGEWQKRVAPLSTKYYNERHFRKRKEERVAKRVEQLSALFLDSPVDYKRWPQEMKRSLGERGVPAQYE